MMEIKAAGRVEGVDISESRILVGSSHLAGNSWDGSLQVFSTTRDLLASIQRPSGCADVCWTKLGQRAVCAEDSGDVKVRREDVCVVGTMFRRNSHQKESPRRPSVWAVGINPHATCLLCITTRESFPRESRYPMECSYSIGFWVFIEEGTALYTTYTAVGSSKLRDG